MNSENTSYMNLIRKQRAEYLYHQITSDSTIFEIIGKEAVEKIEKEVF